MEGKLNSMQAQSPFNTVVVPWDLFADTFLSQQKKLLLSSLTMGKRLSNPNHDPAPLNNSSPLTDCACG